MATVETVAIAHERSKLNFMVSSLPYAFLHLFQRLGLCFRRFNRGNTGCKHSLPTDADLTTQQPGTILDPDPNFWSRQEMRW